ncbi:hypothetical protein BC940DRAFT_296961 [Gongronella butleri]|nr:hypothetical protein BC940DRAFT_296961 [Gongronella butleri]
MHPSRTLTIRLFLPLAKTRACTRRAKKKNNKNKARCHKSQHQDARPFSFFMKIQYDRKKKLIDQAPSIFGSYHVNALLLVFFFGHLPMDKGNWAGREK